MAAEELDQTAITFQINIKAILWLHCLCRSALSVFVDNMEVGRLFVHIDGKDLAAVSLLDRSPSDSNISFFDAK